MLEIRRIHRESRENYGLIKTWEVFKARGIDCGKHRISRLRRKYKIVSKRQRRFKVTTKSKVGSWAAPNKLDQQFQRDEPNKAWVGDVTFIGTRRGTLYLSVLLDLFSRKVVGWSMSNRNNTKLIVNALKMAIMRAKPSQQVLHHSDQGANYTSYEYQDHLRANNFVVSMSRKANCYDNAVAESFFSTLKNELMWGNSFESPDQARKEIFEYIESFYNRRRIHQTLNYLTPEQAELAVVA